MKIRPRTHVPGPPIIAHFQSFVKHEFLFIFDANLFILCRKTKNPQESRGFLCSVPPNKTNLGKKGILCPYAKQIQQIKNGEVVAEFYGASEAKRQTGFNETHIRDCCKGIRRFCGGFEWKFK